MKFAVISVITAVLTGCATSHSNRAVSSIYSGPTEKMKEVINGYRNSNNRKELGLDDKLTTAAQKHADYLVKNNILAHEEPSPNDTPMMRVIAADGDFDYVAENIACGTEDPVTTLNDWIHSPDPQHKANLLSPLMQSFGIALVQPPRRDMKCPYTWVIDFGGMK